MRRYANAATIAAVFLLMSHAAFAQEPSAKPLSRPDPASVHVLLLPLPFGERDRADSDEYFYFHKKGVTYETAFSDLDQCRLFAVTTKLVAKPPAFIPLGTDIVTPGNTPMSHNFQLLFGTVGSLFAMTIIEAAEDDNSRAISRRCMTYKGYARYATSRSAFRQMSAGTEEERLARWALVASGPQPIIGEVGP